MPLSLTPQVGRTFIELYFLFRSQFESLFPPCITFTNMAIFENSHRNYILFISAWKVMVSTKYRVSHASNEIGLNYIKLINYNWTRKCLYMSQCQLAASLMFEWLLWANSANQNTAFHIHVHFRLLINKQVPIWSFLHSFASGLPRGMNFIWKSGFWRLAEPLVQLTTLLVWYKCSKFEHSVQNLNKISNFSSFFLQITC